MFEKDIAKLEFIIEKIEDLFSYQKEFLTVEDLLNSPLGYDATLMCLLQIGETLNKLSDSFIEKYGKGLPIKESYDVRSFIAHDYEGVKREIIENIIKSELKELKQKIGRIISELKTDNDCTG